MRKKTVTRPFLAIVLLAAACGSDRPAGHRVERAVVDGVPVVRTIGAPWHEGPLFDLEQDLVLGIDDGEPEWQIFTRSVWFAVDPRGRLLVANVPDNVIHIVSEAGELERTFGRRGQGPGEFTYVGRCWWLKGELRIDDLRQSRIHRFTEEGDYLGTIGYAEQAEHFQRCEKITDDRFLGSRSDGVPVIKVTYSFLDTDLHWIKDYLTVTGQTMVEVQDGLYYPTPFDAMESIEVYPDGRLLIVNPHRSELTVCSPQGEPLFRMEREWDLAPITAEDRARWRSRFADNPDPTVPVWLKKVEFRSHRYPFTTAMTDDCGRAWVLRGLPLYDEAGQVRAYDLDVFDREGIWLGTQRLEQLPQYIQGNHMYFRTTGTEDEGPRIIRYRLVPQY